MKIPDEAMPAVLLIRQTVPRPKRWELTPRSKMVRFRRKVRPEWGATKRKMARCCPLGLLAGSPSPVPALIAFSELTREQVIATAIWWDAQRDPEAAIAAVWGEE